MQAMRLSLVAAAVIVVFSLAAPLTASDDGGNFRFRKDPELQQIRPKKPVKIKLKRTAKDDYTWELTGDDADEILRIDRKLKEALKQP